MLGNAHELSYFGEPVIRTMDDLTDFATGLIRHWRSHGPALG